MNANLKNHKEPKRIPSSNERVSAITKTATSSAQVAYKKTQAPGIGTKTRSAIAYVRADEGADGVRASANGGLGATEKPTDKNRKYAALGFAFAGLLSAALAGTAQAHTEAHTDVAQTHAHEHLGELKEDLDKIWDDTKNLVDANQKRTDERLDKLEDLISANQDHTNYRLSEIENKTHGYALHLSVTLFLVFLIFAVAIWFLPVRGW